MNNSNLSQITKISNAELQLRISRIYDHLYANSHTRTPHGISDEVGKILHTAMFIEEIDKKIPAFSFSFSELNALSNCNSIFTSKLVNDLRNKFTAMNEIWSLYSKNVEPIKGPYYTLKKLPDTVLSCVSYWTYGNRVGIGIWSDQLIIIRIISEDVAKTYREGIKLIWNTIK